MTCRGRSFSPLRFRQIFHLNPVTLMPEEEKQNLLEILEAENEEKEPWASHEPAPSLWPDSLQHFCSSASAPWSHRIGSDDSWSDSVRCRLTRSPSNRSSCHGNPQIQPHDWAPQTRTKTNCILLTCTKSFFFPNDYKVKVGDLLHPL